MMAAVVVLVVAVGLIIGSFLNVCIFRLPRHESVVWPASRCTACGREISWYENVPVVSWLLLRGRCRSCGVGISAMYPIVEATTAAWFAVCYAWYGLSALGLVRALFGSALIVLFAIDLEHRILPNAITLPGTAIGLVLSVFLPPGWLSSLVGAVVGGGLLFAIGEAYYRWRGVEGLGMGDVKMLAMIGAFLGWQQAIVTLVLASFGGSLVGAFLIAARRGNMQAALPFGTFLAVGAAVAAACGDPLVNWYASLYR